MQQGLTKGGANNGKVKPIQQAATDRRGVVSEILNWILFVGDAKGLVEVVTNEDMATGEKVGPTRLAGLLGLGEFKGIFKGLGKLFSRGENVIGETKTVFTATDGPIDLNKAPSGDPGTSESFGGTFVTEIDITDPKNLAEHTRDNIPLLYLEKARFQVM